MPLSKDLIRSAASQVAMPGSRTDLVSGDAFQWAAVCEGSVSVKISLPDETTADDRARVAADLEIAVRRAAAQAGEDLDALLIQFVDHAGNVIDRAGESNAAGESDGGPGSAGTRAESPQDSASGIPGVRHIIAVGAGKGGVGKSTVAVNLAVALALRGHAVGVLDGDIYGPSLPTLLGLGALDQSVVDGNLQPFLVHGIKAATIGKLVDPDKPLIWRGPMAHGAFNQLTTRTAWGELDYLIVDLPPGTGDVPLTLAQSLSLTGAVIVCTPQKVAQDDAVRAAKMFEQLGVGVLGVVENMSYFVADPDSDGVAKEYDIFGRGGAEQMAQRLGLPFLGALPINMSLRENSDRGAPLRNFEAQTAGGDLLPQAIDALTTQFEAQVRLAAVQRAAERPTLNIS